MVLQSARLVKALETDVRIEAPETVKVGSTFILSIIAEGIPNQEGGLAGWQVALRWDPNVISCTGETINYGYWSDHLGPFFDIPINNEAGCYMQALTLKYPATPVVGTCWLVNLTLRSIAATVVGSRFEIEADKAHGLEYVLFDHSGNYILHNIVDGQVNIQPVTRNVSILDLTISPDPMHVGDIVNIAVTVRNNGDVAETFNVSVHANNTVINTQTVFDLLPSEQTVIICSWNTADASSGSYSVKVYINTISNETYIEDNVRVKEVTIVPEVGSSLVFGPLLMFGSLLTIGALVMSLFVAVFRKRINSTA